MGTRAEALADRVEQGARELSAAVESCSEADWRTSCPDEGWTVGVLVHHVAESYPDEMHLAQILASGLPFPGVSWDDIATMNLRHAMEHANCGKEETLELLRRNSASAASAVRALTDEQLDRAAPVPLHCNAPLTAQYFIEQHPIFHAYSHLASIRAALGTALHP